jgi:NAD(P)-dependent dehydrogenase (short-subunit alcohol dehydrogenase family)
MATIETAELGRPQLGDDLTGRVAMVTGGTRGIGAAICRSLAEHGATVAAGFSRDQQRAEEFKSELADAGATVSIHQGNVGAGEEARRTVREAIDQHGRLDILVNNAGITMDRAIGAMTDDDWHQVIDVNLSGAFFMSRAALPHMLERGSGRIVNISSIIGQTGNIGQANYAASKSGLFGLTMSLAREAAFALKRAERLDPQGAGVTVNAVAPGFIETEMVEGIPEKVRQKLLDQIPLKRFGRADEVARSVVYICSADGDYITGSELSINGGLLM